MAAGFLTTLGGIATKSLEREVQIRALSTQYTHAMQPVANTTVVVVVVVVVLVVVVVIIIKW